MAVPANTGERRDSTPPRTSLLKDGTLQPIVSPERRRATFHGLMSSRIAEDSNAFDGVEMCTFEKVLGFLSSSTGEIGAATGFLFTMWGSGPCAKSAENPIDAKDINLLAGAISNDTAPDSN